MNRNQTDAPKACDASAPSYGGGWRRQDAGGGTTEGWCFDTEPTTGGHLGEMKMIIQSYTPQSPTVSSAEDIIDGLARHCYHCTPTVFLLG